MAGAGVAEVTVVTVDEVDVDVPSTDTALPEKCTLFSTRLATLCLIISHI